VDADTANWRCIRSGHSTGAVDIILYGDAGADLPGNRGLGRREKGSDPDGHRLGLIEMIPVAAAQAAK
jgi:hypothetical protein